MKKKMFFNMSVLTISNIFVRILGLVYKIWLAKEISPVALGIYQLAMSLYSVFITPIGAGLPNATNRLCAKYSAQKNEKTVLASALRIGITLVLFACAIIILGKDLLGSTFLHRTDSARVVLALLPGIAFGAIATLPAGYLHAIGKSNLPAIFEIIEQIGKVACAFVLIRIFGGKDDITDVTLPILAIGFGGVISFILMFASCGKIQVTKGQYTKELLANAYPPTLARLCTSVLHLGTTTVLPLCLVSYGLTEEAALSQYGILTSMAYPVVFIPMTVIGALSVVYLPEVAKNLNNMEQIKRKFKTVFLFSLFTTLGFAVLLFLFAPYFAKKFLKQTVAGHFMVMLIPSVIFLGINQICRTTVMGLGKQKTLMATSILDGAVGLLLTLLLASRYGIYGFIAANCLQDLLAFTVNFIICIICLKGKIKSDKIA